MIEAVSTDNLNDVLPLIAEYQTFYAVDNICEQRNREFFSQFGENSPLGCQFLYRLDGQVVAFATVYFSFSSTIAQKVAILNDVFTLPKARKRGIANKLIEHCRAYASKHNAARLQWVTAPDNKTAQSVYERLPAKRSSWFFYSYPVDSTRR